MTKVQTSKLQATEVFWLGLNTYFMRDSLMDKSSGNSRLSLVASSSLLLLGATITCACSSRVKFFHVKLGSMYSRYISKISLWLTTPGLVKFHIPVRFLFAISMEMGRSSSNIVMEFGILTTFSYREIFVMKLRGFDKSEDIGILTRSVQTFS